MTCSAVDPQALQRSRRQILLALLTALAVVLHTLEALLPSPAPWFRLGFANILTITALFLYGGRAAWTLALARIGIGALLLGQLFAPGFLLSLGGGVTATLLMVSAHRLLPRSLGPVGISLLGATGHATGQLFIAWWLLVQHPGLWRLYPLFLLFALGTGLVNGVAADLLLEMLGRHPACAAPAAGPDAPAKG